MPSGRPVEGVRRKKPCRNGRESWEMLPLRKRGKRAMPSGRPVEGVLRKKPCRNGRESWEMLPLWKEGRR